MRIGFISGALRCNREVNQGFRLITSLPLFVQEHHNSNILDNRPDKKENFFYKLINKLKIDGVCYKKVRVIILRKIRRINVMAQQIDIPVSKIFQL
jgi:hypothetical protein